MSRIIAGIYEIQEQIGAGGGGIVYLGRHMRLEKQIVLKADKRTLNAKSETLRREVDMLKGLSHTYIPQVYDFVQEDGAVYTVMEFIEGESLDKLLRRGQIPAQPQVIRWACQLLEALCYLHSRPPHGVLHGDIKPANIMLRPGGDICLIDYNIALALGEDGAVKVGYSRGYASPEHYGMNYVSGKTGAGQRDNLGTPNAAETEGMPGAGGLPELEGVSGAEGFSETEGVLETEGFSEIGGLSGTEKMPDTDGMLKAGVTETMEPVGIMRSERQCQEVAGDIPISAGSSTGGHRSVMLDVRSDIYSLGATLYHLLSGRRPAQNAFEVEPLGADICSPAVSDILKKAMEPDPAMRYQSAADMLTAFRQLHKRDKRVLRHRRRAAISAALLSVLFLAGGASAFTGLKRLEQRQNALTLAEYSANELARGNITRAVELALQAVPKEKTIFEAPVTAEARKALTDALGVYDLSDGFKALDSIALPSAPFSLELSPDGTYFAAVYQGEAAVFDTESRRLITALPIQNSALSDVIFVDNKRIVYAGDQGVTAYDLEMHQVLWTGEEATTLAVSADRTAVAAVNRDEELAVIYRMSDGSVLKECSFEGKHLPVAENDIFANPNDSIFSLNADGSLLAVSFSDGGLQIFDLIHPGDDLILYDESEYHHFEGGFCGKYFAFSADKNGESLFGLIDTKEAVYVGGYDSRDPFLLKTDENGIYLANGNLLVSFDPDTLDETELAYTDQVKITGFSIGDGYVMTATEEKGFSFYDSAANWMSSENSEENCDFVALAGGYAVAGNRNEPLVRLMKLESHEETLLLSYDARYAHDEARISGDGRTAMFFSYQNFRIYDMDGHILKQLELPDSERIYDQQFVKSQEDSWLEVIWYDGTVRRYSAADGSLIAEIDIEPPSEDLYEEFYTDDYRFASFLHSAPEVYDINSNKLVTTLEKDSYLTYVTQVGEYIITEYVSAAGERYGLLLDGRLQTLAYLPRLCDINNGMLVFDYQSGNLRQCRLYSLQELMTLGERYIE